MNIFQFKNNAKGQLNAGITAIATALTLKAGQGALFPVTAAGKEFRCAVIAADGTIEIIKVTTRVADVFTVIVRAQEGTAASAFLTNDSVQLRLTKESMEAFTQNGETLSVPQTFQVPATKANADTPYTIPDATDRATAPMRTYLADTSGGVLTINLPATPVNGEIVNIKRTTTDGTALTVGRNAKKIEGAAANLVDQNAALSNYRFQYDTTAGSWWLI